LAALDDGLYDVGGEICEPQEPADALSLVQYLRTIGYKAWVEDINGNEIEETALKMAIKSFCD
jgi:hypothetical protein